jgi:hypothetical protein
MPFPVPISLDKQKARPCLFPIEMFLFFHACRFIHREKNEASAVQTVTRRSRENLSTSFLSGGFKVPARS